MFVFTVAHFRLTAILAVLCGVFGLVAARELGASPEPLSREVPASTPANIPVNATAAASFSLPPLQSFAVVAERPLFSMNRQPAPVRSGESEAWASFALAGLIISPDLREALIIHSQPPALVHVQEGDAIDGWTLATVFPDHAVFRNGAVEHELRLDATSKTRKPSGPQLREPPPRG